MTAPLEHNLGVSIRAPAWGATIEQQAAVLTATCFNSRSRMGSDFFCFSLFVAVIAVSIRAPAWGATGQASAIRIVVDSFNSRSRMGSDV